MATLGGGVFDFFQDNDCSENQRVKDSDTSPRKSPKKFAKVIVISSDEEDIPKTPRKVVKATPVRPVSPKFALSKKDILKPEVARTKPLGSFRSAEGSSTTETANRASFTRPSLAAASELEKDTSSSEQREYEAASSQSPVKASHDDIIDLTLSSSESGDSDSEADKREVTSLIYSSPPLSKLSNGVALPSLDRLSLKGESTPRKPVSRRVFDSEGKLNVGPALRPAPEASRRRWMERSPESEDDAPQTAAPIFQPRSLQTLPLRRTPSPQLSPPTSPAKKGKASRVTKKAQREAERTRREAYAEELFKELNASVFNGGLPETTALTWSVRLLTTAGRAKWRRSRDGTQTTEIELATKILDSDDRIRNTLSHEMCHLACWIIDGDPKEGHGRAFKAWAARVTRKRPDITVSTTHSYKIDYPYEWECDYCSKVYGRHSKSIKIEECRCGTCKTGKLVPLFTTRAPKTPKSTGPATRPYGADTDSAEPDKRKHTQVHSGPPRWSIDAELENVTREMGGIRILE